MKIHLTVLVAFTSLTLCAAAEKAPESAFTRTVVKEFPKEFSTTPIPVSATKGKIAIFVRGDVVRPGYYQIPLGSTVEALVHAQNGPDFASCTGSMTILRKERGEIVLYSASGSGLAMDPFRLQEGDRIVYSYPGHSKKG